MDKDNIDPIYLKDFKDNAEKLIEFMLKNDCLLDEVIFICEYLKSEIEMMKNPVVK